MRYLVIFLVLANVVFFLFYPRPAPQVRPAEYTDPLPAGSNHLTLLSERLEIDVAQDQALKTEEFPVELATADVLESDVTTAQEVDEVEIVEESVPEVEVIATTCFAIGPLAEEDEAVTIQKNLSVAGYIAHTRSGEIKEPAGYMVFLPAMTADEAKRVVSDLKKHGVKDYFVGKQNFISLGIFSRKSKASIRQRQIAGYGYNAKLWDRFRTRTVYWVDVQAQTKPLLESATWQDIQLKKADLGLQEVSCE